VTQLSATIEGVALTTVAPCSAPLYPAALAAGRPGLIAVAATEDYEDLQLTLPVGGIFDHYAFNPGQRVRFGQMVAVLRKANGDYIQILSPVDGVFSGGWIAWGTNVSAGQPFMSLQEVDARAPYSNVNDYITIAAPGGGLPSNDRGIWSTVPGGYAYKSGTSMAAPHVAGVAALVRAACPSLTAAEVRDVITAQARDIGPEDWDPAFGAGMVDALGAVLFC
jgi:subtilisin family serine protease